jgi:uncharacterized membrane protein YhaH (DUF805 family)
MDFVSSLRRNLSMPAYIDFRSRASRSEFWWFFLFAQLLPVVPLLIGANALVSLAALFLQLPSLATLVRRMHDVGRSAKWLLIAFTIIGIPVLLYWLVQASEAGPNKYGEGPARA